MPYPQNLQTAIEVEAVIRENGAIPATIAILDGVPCVGISSRVVMRLFMIWELNVIFYFHVNV